MKLSLQNPVWVIISIIQPVLYLTLFGPLLKTIANTPGFPEGNAWQVFVPGLLVQLGIFGAFFVGFGIISEWRSGVIDRMMVTPAHRTALITGRVFRDVIMLVFQAIILIGMSYFFGLRISVFAFIAALFIVALLAAAFSYLSYAAGLALKSEDALAPMINSFALPILLLSGILLPMSLAPKWLQILSDINPIKHVVISLRAVFRDEFITFEVFLGVGLAIIIVVLSGYLGNLVIKNQTK
jgi:ABC-2 type transport system permease protein